MRRRLGLILFEKESWIEHEMKESWTGNKMRRRVGSDKE
jgi:hypothetical protein